MIKSDVLDAKDWQSRRVASFATAAGIAAEMAAGKTNCKSALFACTLQSVDFKTLRGITSQTGIGSQLDNKRENISNNCPERSFLFQRLFNV